jgi:endonuclease-8
MHVPSVPSIEEMPEGDTIHYAANRIRPVLAGQVPDAVATPHPRFGRDRWPERLGGRAVEAVSAHGKHLFLRFEGDLTIHSHLRMTGAWRVHPEGARWSRAPRRAWLVLTKDGTDVVQFDGPVLELLTETRRRFDRRLALLGPDLIAEDFDAAVFLKRLREDDPTRGIGDALLDQRTIAGIGNLWKAEGCWAAEIDPWRPVAAVSDDEVLRIVGDLQPRMRASARDGNQTRDKKIYRLDGRACPRCGERILARGQGDDNRTTYWCPGCQR